MATLITKNSSTAAAVPGTGDLVQGELAVNVTDKKVYTKDSGGAIVKLVGSLGNQEADAASLTAGAREKITISATAASGTINFDAMTQAVLYYTTNSSGNWTLNVRGNGTNTLNSIMSTGQAMTLAFFATNGATAYYQTALTIDGSSVTPKWQGGFPSTGGNASSIDAYALTIVKTANATFTVFISQTRFA